MVNIKSSYTSASSLPIKVFFHIEPEHKINPVHVQLCLTNVCNLKCDFCSCANRDKSQVMNGKMLLDLIKQMKDLKTHAMTITGGGEPTMHPDFDNVITTIHSAGIKLGLVSNGFLLPEHKEVLGLFDWIRVSVAKDRDINKLQLALDQVMDIKTDWAFSYVCQRETDVKSIIWVMRYANEHNFTHVRFVSDLLNVDDGFSNMFHIREILEENKVNDEKAIYQSRTNYTQGARKCLISLLKPVISADGYIYPCCGVQYSKRLYTIDFPEDMRMGKIKDLKSIYEEQGYFDGIKCYRCYYSQYNRVLDVLGNKITHKEFV